MIALLALATALAAPGTGPVQGRVLDSAGAPISGAHTLNLGLFPVQTDGTALWSDELSVTLADGYYSVSLGEAGDLDLDRFAGAGALWLEVGVDGAAMGPRTPVQHVPRAAYAEVAGAVVSDQGARLPSTAEASCGSGNPGALAWDLPRAKVFVCNGTAWQPLLQQYAHIKVYMSAYQTINNGSILNFNNVGWNSGFTHNGTNAVYLHAGRDYRMISRVNTYNPVRDSLYLGYQFYFTPADGSAAYPVGAGAYSQWPSGSTYYGFNAGLYEFYTPPKSGWLSVWVNDDHLASDQVTPSYNTYLIVEEI